MIVIDADDQFVDTIVGSYEEALAQFAPFHPDPQKWEPGWQGADNLFVADWPNGPLHIELHGEDTAKFARLQAMSEREIGLEGITCTVQGPRFGMMQVYVTPETSEAIWQAALAIAKYLHISLDDEVVHEEEKPLIDDERQE